MRWGVPEASNFTLSCHCRPHPSPTHLPTCPLTHPLKHPLLPLLSAALAFPLFPNSLAAEASGVDLSFWVDSLEVLQPAPDYSRQLLTQLESRGGSDGTDSSSSSSSGDGAVDGSSSGVSSDSEATGILSTRSSAVVGSASLHPQDHVKGGLKILVLRTELPPEDKCPTVAAQQRQSYMNVTVSSRGGAERLSGRALRWVRPGEAGWVEWAGSGLGEARWGRGSLPSAAPYLAWLLDLYTDLCTDLPLPAAHRCRLRGCCPALRCYCRCCRTGRVC